MKELKKWKWSYLILTIAVMVLGICLVIWPDISAEILCVLLGVILLIVGVVRSLCYFQRWISVLWHRYELPLGILDMLLGICFISRPSNVLLIFPVVTGVVIIADSVFKLQAALELRENEIKKWWSLLILSILSTIAAFFLIYSPFEGTVAVITCLGISLVIDGVQSLFFIHNVAKSIRKLGPVDVDYIEVE